MLKRSVVTLAAVALALPALAQTPPAASQKPPAASQNKSSAATTAPATHDTGGNPTAGGYNTPSARNPVMTDHGGLRTSKIVGSSVYNDHNEKIGSVDDLVVDKDKTVHAVLSVGGFLGMGNKLVQVPLDKLHFGNTKESSDNRVVLPGATKDSLKSMTVPLHQPGLIALAWGSRSCGIPGSAQRITSDSRSLISAWCSYWTRSEPSASRTETTPIGTPLSTTGMWRKPLSYM